ncbi:hypothetical protein NDU88_002890 [Pleurodeles waltl]|uniref:Uncharacterized protein n=1 Tax=Pleurodeles waltl TaxID=8319 RepID=A0AAV7QB72_PLEWA|nr:hypothetical protein NDU88_002890 [Pleurodeles waltl]
MGPPPMRVPCAVREVPGAGCDLGPRRVEERRGQLRWSSETQAPWRRARGTEEKPGEGEPWDGGSPA